MNTTLPLSHRLIQRAAWTTLGASLLLACGTGDGSAPSTQATQVAAQVGSEEISVSQINQVLNNVRQTGGTPDALKRRSREVLEKLIDQQLAVEQATEAKLHRTPDVVAQLEASRRDILARAYLKQVTSTLAAPTQQEVSVYYREHPALFSGRRIFLVQEIVVARSANLADEFRRLSSGGTSMEGVSDWLRGKQIPFGGGRTTRAAEQVALEYLPLVNALRDGQSAVIETPQATTLLKVLSSQLAPVDEAVAAPRIAQFLTNQRANEAVANQIKLLREATTITYRGEFEALQPDALTDPVAAPALIAPGTGLTPPPQDTLEKGVAGLK